MVDMFASSLNNHLPVFSSPVPDPLAWQMDAFIVPGDDLFVYAYPPFAILRLVLNRALTTSLLRMTLTAPM